MQFENEKEQQKDLRWMERALALARRAAELGEVPVGAVVVSTEAMPMHAGANSINNPIGAHDTLLGEGHNRVIGANDPSAHAEIVALREAAAALKNYRLPGTVLYSTLEPCAMCAGAIIQARVSRVVFAAHDPRAGAGGSVFNVLTDSRLNHRCRVESGIGRGQSEDLLRSFFKTRRNARVEQNPS